MTLENKIALSIDVEDWYHTPLVTGSPFAKYKNTQQFFEKWKGDYDMITTSTLRLLDLLDKQGITATFFILGDVVKRYKEIVEKLKNSSHEIACHGQDHQIALDPNSKKPLISVKDWMVEVKNSKALLEDTFQRPVIGYRAPGAYFGKWMVQGLETLGFSYDSSIAYNSFYNKTDCKLASVPTFPYRLNRDDLSSDNPNSNLVELPWSYLKLFNIRFPVGGAFFYRLLGNRYFKFALNSCLRKGDTMFYLHPYDLTAEKIPIGNLRSRPFFWINQGKTTEMRFEKLLISFKDSFTTCEEVYNRSVK
ncbi:MAG: polysaccharide deacetylase [Bacteroidetes bacterium]|nr:MAG: polysaccharide deacetylase [Bacteroidota bacterium]